MTKKISLGEALAEFIGSMLLVMSTVSSMILFTMVFDASIGIAVFANAITVTFVLCALIELFMPISGAHFNPVVSIVMAFEKKIAFSKAAIYIIFQIIGGLAGIALSHLMYFDKIGGIFFISDYVRSDYIYIGEIVGTFILVLTFLILAKAKSRKISIIVSMMVGGQIMATSSTMFANPQVTIARIFTNTPTGIRPTDAMIFVIMQFIGAALAYGVYKLMFLQNKAKEER